MTTTQLLRGSELYEKVILAIHEIRYPTELSQYERALKRYERLLGTKREMTFVKQEHVGEHLLGEQKIKGFLTTRAPKDFRWQPFRGQILVERPERPEPVAFYRQDYDRSMGFTTHAANRGLLADSRFNRDISHRRVEEYTTTMQLGKWCDLLSDPISITEQGEVINGQHRLAAASEVDWSKVDNDPLFLVIRGVDPEEALHADLSKRTAKEQTAIVSKVAGVLLPGPQAVTEDAILAAAIKTAS